MIHYHGGPITPEPAAHRAWRSGHAFISFAHQQQFGLATEITQSFALDNGAFSFWKSNKVVDWNDFYKWVFDLRSHPRFDFAVAPDVIEGSEAENDDLLASCPLPKHQIAAVWHINESIDRFIRLAYSYPRVCIGSSGVFDVSSPKRFLSRAKTAIRFVCDATGRPVCKLHGLRMLNPSIFTQLPLSSADSTNIAMNIGKDDNWSRGNYLPHSKETRAWIMRERIESKSSADKLEWLSVREIGMVRQLRTYGWSDNAIATQFRVLKASDIDAICVP